METPQVLPKREDEAPDVQDDPTLSQVLLSRVLIEEYEALAQPKSDDARFNDLKYKSYCDGDIVKDIYQLINKVQREHVSEVRASYETKYKEWINDDTVRQEVVGQAVLADVFGEIDELRNGVNEELTERFSDIQEGERLEALKENGLIQKLRERARNGVSTVSDQPRPKFSDQLMSLRRRHSQCDFQSGNSTGPRATWSAGEV